MPVPGKVAFGFVLRCGCAFLLCLAVWSASGQDPAPRSSGHFRRSIQRSTPLRWKSFTTSRMFP